jgi:hypothetical protein
MLHFRSRARRHRWVTLAVSLLGCGSLVDPPLPPNTVPMTAPAVYSLWWNTVEACSGITRPIAAVRWYQVQNTTEFIDYKGRDISGYWSPASNEIVVAEHEALDGELVRHEMLHALTRLPGHPRDEFLGKCAGVVVCVDDCIRDAGPPPPFHSRPLATDSLELSYRIDPATPAAGKNDGTFMVTVYATNPTADSILAIANPKFGAGISFLWDIRGGFGGRQMQVSFDDSSLVRFKPHETKQQVFDFRIGTDSELTVFPPGEYTLRVAYGFKSSVAAPLTLAP